MTNYRYEYTEKHSTNSLIQYVRFQLKFSRKKFAKMLCITEQTLMKYELLIHKPRPHVIKLFIELCKNHGLDITEKDILADYESNETS